MGRGGFDGAATATRKAAVEEALAGQRGGPVKECPTMRKAAAGSSVGEDAKAAAGEKCAAEVTMAASGTGGRKGWTRMSKEYVESILSLKPDPIQDPDEYYERMMNDPLKCFSKEYIEESTETLRVLADMTKRNAARFEKFQSWVRREYEEKGYVEVDDDYIALRVQLSQAVTQEEWDADMGLIKMEGDEEDGGGFNTMETREEGVALEITAN